MIIDQKELIKYVEKLPAFPQSVTKVIELTSRAECSPKELVKVIEHDPVLTVKILKLVNSAFYGLSKPIKSINHGIVYAGFNTIKNLSVSIAAIGVLPRKNAIGFDIDALLLHSIGVAIVSKRLANSLSVNPKEASDYFIAGLLHDFGKVVLIQYKPDAYRQALDQAGDGSRPLYEAEKAVFGLDHAEVGALLAKTWNLPDHLVEGISRHHEPDANPNKLVDCIFAADQVIHSLSFGDSGNKFITPFSERLIERFGRDLPDLITVLGDLDDEMEKTRSYISG
jgi:putative nucleotidyltransferase with HDIG domain